MGRETGARQTHKPPGFSFGQSLQPPDGAALKAQHPLTRASEQLQQLAQMLPTEVYKLRPQQYDLGASAQAPAIQLARARPRRAEKALRLIGIFECVAPEKLDVSQMLAHPIGLGTAQNPAFPVYAEQTDRRPAIGFSYIHIYFRI